jgi:hypothetical protein
MADRFALHRQLRDLPMLKLSSTISCPLRLAH